MISFIRCITLVLLLSGFSSQPGDERKLQNSLPEAHGLMWTVLGGTVVDFNEKTGAYSAKFSDGLKALVGKEMTIQGFMLPLEATEKFKHFILSKRTPTCQFCPPGAPNEIIDIWSDKPVSWNENIVTVTGVFSLENNQEMGMFFKISHATVK